MGVCMSTNNVEDASKKQSQHQQQPQQTNLAKSGSFVTPKSDDATTPSPHHTNTNNNNSSPRDMSMRPNINTANLNGGGENSPSPRRVIHHESDVINAQSRYESPRKAVEVPDPLLRQLVTSPMGLRHVDPVTMQWIRQSEDANQLLVTFYESPYSKCSVAISQESTLQELRTILVQHYQSFLSTYDIKNGEFSFMHNGKSISESAEASKLIKDIFSARKEELPYHKDESQQQHLSKDFMGNYYTSNFVYIQKVDAQSDLHFRLFEECCDYIKVNEPDNMVKLLCREEAKLLPIQQDSMGRTLLHYACLYSNLFAVRALIKLGSCINANVCSDRWTPMHIAAHKNSKEIVEELIKSGADMRLVDQQDRTPILLALSYDLYDMVEFLYRNNKENTNELVKNMILTKYNIEQIFKDDNVEKFNQLLTLFHPSQLKQDVLGLTVYHQCAMHNSENLFGLLTRMRVEQQDVLAADLAGNTILHFAAAKGYTSIINLTLNKYKAELIEARDGCGRTPLLVALENKQEAAAQLLVKSGANVANAEYVFGYNAIHYAVANGYHNLLVELCQASESGASQQNPITIPKRRPDEEDKVDNGPSPIMLAVLSKDLVSVDVLLRFNTLDTITNQVDRMGRSAISLCISQQNWEALIAIASKFDISIPTDVFDRMTSFESRNLQALKILLEKTHSSQLVYLVAADGWLEGVKQILSAVQGKETERKIAGALFLGAATKKHVDIVNYVLSQKPSFTFTVDIIQLMMQRKSSLYSVYELESAFTETSSPLVAALALSPEITIAVLSNSSYALNEDPAVTEGIPFTRNDEPRNMGALSVLLYLGPTTEFSINHELAQKYIEAASLFVQKLAPNSPALHAVDPYNRNPLLLAAARGYWPVVDLLITSNADTGFKNDEFSALYYCCKGGNASSVLRIIARNPELVGVDLVEVAVRGNKVDVVQALCTHLLKEASADTLTALVGIACVHNCTTLISMLHSHFDFATVKEQDIVNAIRSNSTNVLKYILTQQSEQRRQELLLSEPAVSALFQVMNQGAQDLPMELIDVCPALSNAKNDSYTLFSTAAMAGSDNVLIYLLQQKNSAEQKELILNKDDQGLNALDYARLFGKVDTSTLLASYLEDKQGSENPDEAKQDFTLHTPTILSTTETKPRELEPVVQGNYLRHNALLEMLVSGYPVSDSQYNSLFHDCVTKGFDENLKKILLSNLGKKLLHNENGYNVTSYFIRCCSDGASNKGSNHENVAIALLGYMLKHLSQEEILKKIEELDSDFLIIHGICSAGYSRLLKLWLDSFGTNKFPQTNADGLTPFDCARLLSHLACMKILIQYELDVTGADIGDICKYRYNKASKQISQFSYSTGNWEPISDE